MTDLFDFGRARASEVDGDYGLSGDMKKTQYVLQLLGSPADADTLKCLITAVEVGLETDSAALDILTGQQYSEDYLAVSPLGLVPTLKEADYFVSGEAGVMSYIEARGLGKRLRPQNAKLLAEQCYWSDVACHDVQPSVQRLLNECVLKPLISPGYSIDRAVVNGARETVRTGLNALDKQLQGRDFIIGQYSFADIHWTVCVHLLIEAGETALVNDYEGVKQWFERIAKHKSFSGQNIIAFDLLPKRNDIINQRLNSVVIDDY